MEWQSLLIYTVEGGEVGVTGDLDETGIMVKHHSASKSNFNLEILHTLKDLLYAGLFFLDNFFFVCKWRINHFKLSYGYQIVWGHFMKLFHVCW